MQTLIQHPKMASGVALDIANQTSQPSQTLQLDAGSLHRINRI
jgi:hypothetical protein